MQASILSILNTIRYSMKAILAVLMAIFLASAEGAWTDPVMFLKFALELKFRESYTDPRTNAVHALAECREEGIGNTMYYLQFEKDMLTTMRVIGESSDVCHPKITGNDSNIFLMFHNNEGYLLFKESKNSGCT